MNGYIDTSALVAYYYPEPLSAVVERVVRKLARPTISPLVEVELYSAVSLKLRVRELDSVAAREVIATFRLHMNEGLYALVPIDERVYDLAQRWIGEFSTPLRTLDALHLAAAFANDMPILTTDKALVRAAKALRVKHRLIA